MKKIISVLIFSVLITGSTFASGYTITVSDKLIINKLNNKIKPLLKKQTLAFREKLETKINELQEQYKKNKQLYYILEQIKDDNYMFNHKSEYTKHYKDYKIDFNRVKNTWLKRHNDARANLGVAPYTYDERLDNTGDEWSREQRINGYMSHKKNGDTAFYNYTVVEKWFNDRGVKCKVAGGATSSESIGKFGFYCKDGECTDEFLESLKVIFDIYMAEKDLGFANNAHYRGIVLSSLTKMGLGLAFYETDEKKYYEYYMTTHYCTEFKD
ncbi:MAG: CAP domain-containing protein [Candidatus Gracilibacteria bacterium]